MPLNGPCIVQRDRTIVLEVNHHGFEAARKQLSQYAELVKSPSSFHTYRMTPLSLWNAAAAGWTPERVRESLASLSRWQVPDLLLEEVVRLMSRYGQLSLRKHREKEGWLSLHAARADMMDELRGRASLQMTGLSILSGLEAEIPADRRGLLKQELMRLGYPVLDYAGYLDGQFLCVRWQEEDGSGRSGFRLRDYQKEAAEAFRDSEGRGGSGVLVLPCGAGKTVIGLAAMQELQCETLILTSNATSVSQWVQELLDKTTLTAAEIGMYTGQSKEVRPVTVATYQILTHRRGKAGELYHMKLFNERKWGLIIYDEVHLLPAPVFRATADIQATRRLGLTATLVREDGREDDVFSLIGPKRYEMPWKPLEEKGWIAAVECTELKVPMQEELRKRYESAGKREQYRLASENSAKMQAVELLLKRHAGAQILIIGQYIDQLRTMAESLKLPLISGRTPQDARRGLYTAFRAGEIQILVVSKVANFAVDLPDASVAIEVSGSYGSRQEEAQRLGRILRPKSGGNRAYFYALVTEGSREESFALRRQLFLIEQGYEYRTAALRSALEAAGDRAESGLGGTGTKETDTG